MRMITAERIENGTRGAGLLALVVVAWAFLVPGTLFWTAVAAIGLLGVTFATVVLVRSRRMPTLAQVIASAEAEPAIAGASGGAGEAAARLGPGPRS